MAFQVGTKEAARQLGISPRRARMLLEDGQLVGEKVGRDWLIRQASIESWSKRRRGPGRPKLPTRKRLDRVIKLPAGMTQAEAAQLLKKAREVRDLLRPVDKR